MFSLVTDLFVVIFLSHMLRLSVSSSFPTLLWRPWPVGVTGNPTHTVTAECHTMNGLMNQNTAVNLAAWVHTNTHICSSRLCCVVRSMRKKNFTWRKCRTWDEKIQMSNGVINSDCFIKTSLNVCVNAVFMCVCVTVCVACFGAQQQLASSSSCSIETRCL